MKAVLVGIQLPSVDDEEFSASLRELERLVNTLGYQVVGVLTQKRSTPAPATAIGEGKLAELALWTGGTGKVASPTPPGKAAQRNSKESEEDELRPSPSPAPAARADKVIFDLELSPNQFKHLQEATGVEVLDRTGVIVEIFSRHAKTREARLQVEIARLKYLAPRIRVAGTTDRQGGGIGAKGIGETAHELDRRRIRDRVAELQRELAAIHVDQEHRRERRKDKQRVALVGYTNAGKSSLMRALTGSQVLVADKLFATLDTTVRVMVPDSFPRVLLADTVGFIKKLPHDLVASFRSTLDEASEASLLLYVVDASDPTFRSQWEVTRQVIGEIGAADIAWRLILNKADLLDPIRRAALAREFPDALIVSTREPDDVDRVRNAIREFMTRSMEQAEFLVRYDDRGGLLGEIRKSAAVLKEEHGEDGVHLTVRTYPEVLAKLRKRQSA